MIAIATEPRPMAADPKAIALALKLARARARKHPALADEFESAALVALVEAEATFDKAIGVPFHKHAGRRIAMAMVDCQREWMPKGFGRSRQREKHGAPPRLASLESAHFVDDRGLPRRLADLVDAEEDGPGSGAEYHDDIARFCRGLPRQHRAIIQLMYGHAGTVTQTAAGRALGLSKSRATQLHSQALFLIRENLKVMANSNGVANGRHPDTGFGPGLGIGDPSPEEVAEIEARKAAIRAEEVAGDRGLPPHSNPRGYCEPRDGHRRKYAGERMTLEDLSTTTILPLDATPADGPADPATMPPAPRSKGSCPDCGKPYGQRARCYVCLSRKMHEAKSAKATTEPVPAAITPEPTFTPTREPITPAPTTPLLAEIEAMRQVALVLDGLDAATAGRVIAWFAVRTERP